MKKNKRYLAPVIAAVVIFCIYLYIGKIFSAETVGKVMGVLSDGFFAAAVLVGGVGLISFAGKFSTFDMLSYGTKSFFGNFIHSLRDNLPKTFYDYKVQKDKDGRSYLKEFCKVGAVCLILGIIMLVLYFIL